MSEGCDRLVVVGGGPGLSLAKEVGMKRRSVNVGTVGHVDYGKVCGVIQSVDRGKSRKSDRKRNRKNRWS